MMAGRGFAVLDFETTGLSADGADRVIEVAVVLVDPDGQITGRFETLINPGRDTGPTHIHGVYNADVRHAPTFQQALPQLTALLAGRVFVAHNTAFDSRFLAAGMRRAGVTSPVNLRNSMCTMLLSTTFLAIDSKSLAACCTAQGIALDDAHRASADTMATALLLASFIAARPDWDGWAAALDAAEATVWPELDGLTMTHTRENAVASVSFAHRIPVTSGGAGTESARAEYIELVDAALTAFDPPAGTVDMIVNFAGIVGLNRAECEALNLAHFRVLTAQAWVDGTLTDAEQRHLVAAARLLSVGGIELTTALRPPASDAERELSLEPGAKIVLTGFCAADKRALVTLIEAAGYVVWPSLVKTTGLLVATDTDSLSTKGRTARRFGVPITDELGLRALLTAAL